MQTKGTRRLIGGGIALAATIFILPTALFEVVSGTAQGAAVVLFTLGAILLVGGLYLVITGLRKRSRDLRTPRSYDTRQGTTKDEDRPVDGHSMPTAARQGQIGIF
ncbi:hypothetical protein [Arthrobacter sp. H20]|uniref:hypothetical protein n=1 Tax=Arthrobacter sp. H20 TaxID=1267981 RepID=UPI00047E7317|nr:hypothetical protein [Arthrobacter sp. H20]